MNEIRCVEIGNNIQYFRNQKNLTRKQLAVAVGISEQYLGSIEAQGICPSVSLKLLFCIADELDIDVRMLFDFHGKDK